MIVDDEILVQVGIQSLLSQTALNVQVCGTARNGQIALELIEEQSPDIVITDIKMPVMDGLELTPEVLQESITRALSKLHRAQEPDFHYAGYVCCYGEIVSTSADALPREKQLSLFASSLQMIRELAPKYMPCYALSLDMQHFALIFCYETLPEPAAPGQDHTYPEQLAHILTQVSAALKNYYSVSLQCGVGSLVNTPFAVSDSYQCSRQAYQAGSPSCPITFFERLENVAAHSSFNIGIFKNDLCKAFEEYDPETLPRTIRSICELFSAHPQYYVQALDAACNILYLSISTLPDGENVISDIYKNTPMGYCSVYRQTTVEQVVSWLGGFGEKLSAYFEEKRRDYKNYIVINVKSILTVISGNICPSTK